MLEPELVRFPPRFAHVFGLVPSRLGVIHGYYDDEAGVLVRGQFDAALARLQAKSVPISVPALAAELGLQISDVDLQAALRIRGWR